MARHARWSLAGLALLWALPALAAPLPPLSTLTPAQSCGDVAAAARRQSLREMNATLDINLEAALQALHQPCYSYNSGSGHPSGSSGGFGCGTSMATAAGGSYYDGNSADGGMHSADAGAAPATGESATEYSTTNTQEADVDEADFVKNDGAYIYLVSNGKLRIVDAWPPAQAHAVAAVSVDGTPTGLFVYADRAVVYTRLAGGFNQSPCTYGYDCSFSGQPGPWAILVYDISNRAAPRLVRRQTFDAALVSSRRIGNIVHTLMLFGAAGQPPQYPTWPEGISMYAYSCGEQPTAAQVRQKFADLRASNVALLEGLGHVVASGLSDERLEGESWIRDDQQLTSCRNMYISETAYGTALLTLASFDLTATQPARTTSVMGLPGAVYASRQALYVAQSDLSPASYSSGGVTETTAVHKFRLAENAVDTSYVGSGEVPGHVLSQYSMDELDGRLRVATSVGRVPDPTVHSVVTVLAEEQGTLTAVGKLDAIAPGEDIRSVLFDGTTVYLVTFKKTDPLFVIDLTDPMAPTIRAELKVPGFSTALQMLDATHILSIGFDAQDMGSYAWFQGIQLQIFDVSDPYNPRQTHKELIGTRGTTSEAATNHLAFNYFAPRQALALPIAICEDSAGGGNYGTVLTFDGLLVYRVSVTDGFSRVGGLPLTNRDAGNSSAGSCSNWWTNPNSGVKRSIFMDDYVYAVGLDVLRTGALADLGHPLATVSLAP